MAAKSRRAMSVIRHQRIRKHIHGTAARPRLAVFRSARHIYVQLIDDDKGVTVVSASSQAKDIDRSKKPLEVAAAVGTALAEAAKGAKVKSVVFDRGGFKYHGRVKALAESARAAGLEF